MSPNILIAALFVYPVVYILPLNPIRFRWGFRRGLTAMPPEVQEHAEAADRLALLIARSILVVTVVLLMHGFRISAKDLGFTAEHWEFPIEMGLVLGLIPGGLSARFLPRSRAKAAQKDLEASGPVATWCGLIPLGVFATELWRAFCIVALLRLGVAAWLAIVIVAIFYAAIWLQTSIARALGTATFGGVAGTLFVYTGSLLAPLTMGLIREIIHFYRVRYTLRDEGSDSPFYCPCPLCKGGLRRRDILLSRFNCPHCFKQLKPCFFPGYFWVRVIFVVAIYAVPVMFLWDLVVREFFLPKKFEQATSSTTTLDLSSK